MAEPDELVQARLRHWLASHNVDEWDIAPAKPAPKAGGFPWLLVGYIVLLLVLAGLSFAIWKGIIR